MTRARSGHAETRKKPGRSQLGTARGTDRALRVLCASACQNASSHAAERCNAIAIRSCAANAVNPPHARREETRRTEADQQRVLAAPNPSPAPTAVQLVKGAFDDRRAHVFQRRGEIDRDYLRLADGMPVPSARRAPARPSPLLLNAIASRIRLTHPASSCIVRFENAALTGISGRTSMTYSRRGRSR